VLRLPEEVAFAAQYACLLEVGVEKPGNVTPAHAFRDMRYEDFVRSALAIGPEIALAGTRCVGATVLAAITATRRWVSVNTNLGIVLLFTPLARSALCRPAGDLRDQVRQELRQLTVEDARLAYAAIRRAVPGGLADKVETQDVHDEPTVTLREAMAYAVGRDRVAAEYLSDYAITFEHGLPALRAALSEGLSERDAARQVFLQLLAAFPDTLIARKLGPSAAEAVSRQAAAVLAAGGPNTTAGRQALADFDVSLRDPANTLNPGTTADLVTTTLFVAMLEGLLV
jgi:triphosphoribosyl-dephospho-CoA synthase